jgi:hypothetical protein
MNNTHSEIFALRKILTTAERNNNDVHLTVAVGMNLSRSVLPSTRAYTVCTLCALKRLLYYYYYYYYYYHYFYHHHHHHHHYPTEQIYLDDNNYSNMNINVCILSSHKVCTAIFFIPAIQPLYYSVVPTKRIIVCLVCLYSGRQLLFFTIPAHCSVFYTSSPPYQHAR